MCQPLQHKLSNRALELATNFEQVMRVVEFCPDDNLRRAALHVAACFAETPEHWRSIQDCTDEGSMAQFADRKIDELEGQPA